MEYVNYILRNIILSWSQVLIYRFRFFLEVLFSGISIFVEIYLIELYFELSYEINGWNEESFKLLFGVFNIILFINRFFFHEGIFDLPYDLLYGNIDSLLMYPMDSLFAVSFSKIDFGAIPLLVTGGYFYFSYSSSFELWSVLNTLYFILSGIFCLYAFQVIVAIFCFVFPNLNNVSDLSAVMVSTGSKPFSLYSDLINNVLIAVCPLVFATNFAVFSSNDRFIDSSYYLIALVPLITILVAHKTWKYVIKFYHSAN